MGIPFWGGRDDFRGRATPAGHEIQTLGLDDGADHAFAPDETAEAVVARVARDWPPDLLLCGCPEMHPPPLAVECCPIPTVACISDWNLHHPQLAWNLARFDLVLGDLPASRGLAVPDATIRHWAPLYSHRPAIHRDLGRARDLDVVFAGSLNHALHPRRAQALAQVAAQSARWRVRIETGLPPADYAALMNRARIVLNHSVRGEMNLRCFEAPACGALLFVEEDNAEVGQWLAPDRECVLYTPENLLERMAYFLEHEDERARIAAAGQRRVAALDPDNRIDDFLAWIAAAPRQPRTFGDWPPARRAVADLLLYGAGMDAAQRHWAQARAESLANAHPEDAAAQLAAAGVLLDAAAEGGPGAREAALKRAVRLLHTATALRPEDATPWLNLADVAGRLGARTLARQCLDAATGATEAGLGALLSGLPSDPAFAAWRRALPLGNADAAFLRAVAETRIAGLDLEDGDPAAALARAESAAPQLPGLPAPHRTAAAAHRALGDPAREAAALRAALAPNPFDGPVRGDLIRALRDAGDTAAARACAAEGAALFSACPAWVALSARFAALSE